MCRQRGFRPRGYHFVKELKDGYCGLLDITYHSYTNGREVYVMVGIQNNGIDHIHESIMGKQPGKLQNMRLLLMQNIGYLFQEDPHYLSWFVDETSDIKEVCNTIFHMIDTCCPAFFEKYSNTEALIRAYENHKEHPTIVSYAVYRTLPELYLFNHQKEKGLDYILHYCSEQECLSKYDLAYTEGYNGLLATPLLDTIQPGDIFSLIADSGRKYYFQAIAKDTTAYGSDVIRIFKNSYPRDATPSTTEIVDDDVECYMHTMVSWGLYLGLWTRSGSDDNIGKLDISFRRSNDYGRFSLFEKRVSNNWEVWTMNQPKQSVGMLPESHYSADIGDIGSPSTVLKRINEGYFPSEWYPLCREQQ